MGDEITYPESKPSQPREDIGQSARVMWDEMLRESPLNRLRYLDARLAAGARVDKDRVAELVREAGAVAVLADRDATGLVRQLFGEPGVKRLKDRARAEARHPNVVEDLAHPVHQRGAR